MSRGMICSLENAIDKPMKFFPVQFWGQLNRSVIYSLSPGSGVTPTMAKEVNGLANMYRITGDDWDTWDDVASHFDISR